MKSRKSKVFLKERLSKATCLLLVSSLFLPSLGHATNYNVNSFATLNSAIVNTNSGPGNDTITITGDFSITVDIIPITREVTIIGNNNTLTANGSVRVFQINNVSGGTVTIQDVVVIQSAAIGGAGASRTSSFAGLSGTGGGGLGAGGGAYVAGQVVLKNCTFTSPKAVGGSGGGSSGASGNTGSGGGGPSFAGVKDASTSTGGTGAGNGGAGAGVTGGSASGLGGGGGGGGGTSSGARGPGGAGAFGGGGGGGGRGTSGTGTGGAGGTLGGSGSTGVANVGNGGGGGAAGGLFFVGQNAILSIESIQYTPNGTPVAGGSGGSGGGGTDGSSGTTAGPDIFLYNGASLVFNQTSGTLTANFQIDTHSSLTDGGIEKDGAGTVILSAPNSYKGGTTIEAGTLQISSNDNLGATDGVIFGTSGTLATSSSIVFAFPISVSGIATFSPASETSLTVSAIFGLAPSASVEKSDTGTLILDGANTFEGGLTINSGTCTLGGTISELNPLVVGINSTTTATFDISANGTTVASLSGGTGGRIILGTQSLIFGSDNTSSTYAGTISGSGSLTKEGAGTFTLSAASGSYTGSTTLNSGLLALTISEAIGSGPLSMAADTGLILSGGTSFSNDIDFAGNASFDIDSGTSTLSGVIIGSGTVAKDGSGTLVLSNNSNSYSGATNVNTGTLSVLASGALGSSSLQMFTNTTLNLGNAVNISNDFFLDNLSNVTVTVGPGDTAEISSAISGSDAILQKSSSGTLVLSNGTTYSGGTTLTGGILSLTADDAMGFGPLIMADNTTLSLGAVTTFSNDITLSGTGFINVTSGASALLGNIYGSTLTKTGNGILILSGSSTSYSGGTNLSGGTLSLTANGVIGTGSVSMLDLTTLSLGDSTSFTNDISLTGTDTVATGTGTSTLSGNITGTGSLNKTGSGILVLSGSASSYSGGTSLTAGTLSLTEAEAIGTGSLSMETTTVLDLVTTANIVNDVIITGTADINVSNVANSGLTGVISGDILQKTGTGSLLLSNTNGYTGGTNLTDGAIVVAANGALGIGPLNMTGNTTLSFSNSAALPNDVAIDTSSIGVFAVSTGNTGTINGEISGTGAYLQKIDPGTLVLAHSGSYSGGTYLTEGILSLTASDAMGSGALEMSNSTTLSLGDVTSFANEINLTGTDIILVPSGTSTLSGLILGSGALAKYGSGTLVLTEGGNVYASGTTLNEGTISLGSDGALGFNALTIADNATLALQAGVSPANDIAINASQTGIVNVASSTSTLSGIISGSNSNLVKTGSGILVLTAANPISGTVGIEEGVLKLTNSGTLESATINLSGSTANFDISTISASSATITNLEGDASLAIVTLGVKDLTLGNSASTEFEGDIQGTGKIIKQGSGTLALANAISCTGATQINAGTVSLVDLGALANSPVEIGASGSFNIAGVSASTSVASLEGPSGATAFLGSKTLQVGNGNTNTTFAGVISGSGSVVKEGSGDLTLSGVNNYTGTTTVISGVLALVGNGTISPTLVAEGGTLDYTNLAGATLAVSDFITSGISTIDNGTKDFIMNTASINGMPSIIGSGDVIKQTTGLFNSISGSTFTVVGDFLIEGGTALINGEVDAPNVINSALVKGNGSFTGNLTNSSVGTISPGQSIGILTINSGDYIENGTYEVEINTSSQSDLIAVTNGSIMINPGSTLTVIPEISINYLPDEEFVIMQAPLGTVSGSYTNIINTTLPLLDFSIVYNPNNVVLKINSKSFNSFSDLVKGGNIGSVANYLDYLMPDATGDLLYVINQLRLLNLPELENALNQMQPASFIDISLSQQNNSYHVRQVLSQRVAQLYNAPCMQERFKKDKVSVWMDALYDYSSQDGIASRRLFGFRNSMEGGVLGIDYEAIQNLFVGAFGGYTYSNIQWKESSDHAHINSGYLGLYATYLMKHLFANFSLMGSYSTYKGSRQIEFGAINRRALHSNHAEGIDTHFDFGLILPAGSIEILPYGSIDYSRLHEGELKEKGADSIDLHTRGENYSLLRVATGLNFTTCLKILDAKWVPNLRLGFVREIRYKDTQYTSNFIGSPGQFTVIGLNPSRTMVSPGLSLTGVFHQDRISFSMGYDAEIDSTFTDQMGSIQIGISF